MKSIDIDDVVVGADLAADLLDDQGRLLMRQGTVLDEAKLLALRGRNVAIIQIAAEHEADDAAIEAQRLEIVESIERRFFNHRANPLMRQLKDAVIEYRVKAVR